MRLVDAEPLITKKELAEFLNVHVRTITRMVTDGMIPSVKVGRVAVRFSLKDVMEALERKEE